MDQPKIIIFHKLFPVSKLRKTIGQSTINYKYQMCAWFLLIPPNSIFQSIIRYISCSWRHYVGSGIRCLWCEYKLLAAQLHRRMCEVTHQMQHIYITYPNIMVAGSVSRIIMPISDCSNIMISCPEKIQGFAIFSFWCLSWQLCCERDRFSCLATCVECLVEGQWVNCKSQL